MCGRIYNLVLKEFLQLRRDTYGPLPPDRSAAHSDDHLRLCGDIRVSTTSRPRCSISTTARRAASCSRVSPPADAFASSSIAKNPDRDPQLRSTGRTRRSRSSSRPVSRNNCARAKLGAAADHRRRHELQHRADRARLRQPNRLNLRTGSGQDLARRRLHAGQPPPPHVTLEPRPWYNPDYNSRWFFVPGVIATLTLVMVVNLTSFRGGARAGGRHARTDHGHADPAARVHSRQDHPVLLRRARADGAGRRAPARSGSRSRSSAIRSCYLLGTSLYLLSVLGIGLLISTVCIDPAAGVRDQLLRHQSGLHRSPASASRSPACRPSCNGSRPLIR